MSANTKKYGYKYEVQRDRTDELMLNRGKHCCAPHFHKQLEIVYCDMGKQIVTVNNSRYTLTRGDVLVISPYAVHSYDRSHARCTVACIPTVFYQYYAKYFSNLSQNKLVIESKSRTRNILRAMLKLRKMRDKNHYCQLSAVLEILGEMLEKGDFPESADGADNELVAVITAYINNNYTQKIDLASLAAHCNYSKAYLSAFFKEHFNCSFNDFVNIVRLNAFVELQSAMGGSFSSNALAVGFQTSRTFYNVFRERYQMTPTEYFSKR